MPTPKEESMNYEIADLHESYIVGYDKAGQPILKDAFGNLFNPAEEAEYFSTREKLDTVLNMRINSRVIEDLKQVAAKHGEKNYQVYIRKILYGIAMQAKTS